MIAKPIAQTLVVLTILATAAQSFGPDPQPDGAPPAAAEAKDDYVLGLYTVHGGGGSSSGGDFVVRGTAGAPAENLAGGDFEVRGGFWQPASPGPADISGDGAVDAFDLGALLGAWGPSAGHAADLNGDGVVDALDLGQLLGSWGPCAS